MDAWDHLSLAQRALAFRDLGRARTLAELALKGFQTPQQEIEVELQPDEEAIERYRTMIEEELDIPVKRSPNYEVLTDIAAGMRMAKLIVDREPDVFSGLHRNLSSKLQDEEHEPTMVFLSMIRSDGSGEINGYPPSLDSADLFGVISERVRVLDGRTGPLQSTVWVFRDSPERAARKDHDRFRFALFSTDFSLHVLVLRTPFCQVRGRLLSVQDKSLSVADDLVAWLQSLLD